MANSLNGVSIGELAQESLPYLKQKLNKIALFSTDFSAAVSQKGASVTTRVVGADTAVSLSSGYASAASAANSTEKTVTLDQFKGVVKSFSDEEISKSAIDLVKLFSQPAIDATVKAMHNAATALVTAANFGGAAFTGAATAFGYDDVVDLGAAMDDAGVGDNRALILNTAFFKALLKDSDIKGAYAAVLAEAVATGKLANLAGFQLSQLPGLPANGENLAGFAADQSAIIVASRVPETPANFTGEIETLTDPETNFSIQFRKWYSNDLGKHFLSVGVIYGVGVGIPGALKRLVTA